MHELFVYRSVYFYKGQWVANCEAHSFNAHSGLFAGAVGLAMMHKYKETR